MSSGSSATETFRFDIPAERPPETPTIKFAINNGSDDEEFTLVQPKMSIGVGMINLLEQEGQFARMEFGIKMGHLLWSFVGYVQDEDPEPMMVPVDEDDPDSELVPNPYAGRKRGRSRLMERLQDPRDAMDILDLEPMFRQLVNKMFNRPTGPSPASSSKPAPSGAGSGAGSRARRAKTSGTSKGRSSSTPPKTSAANASSGG